MDKNEFERAVSAFASGDPGNYIAKEAAIRPDLAGMRIFDEPLFGYASAGDPLFEEFKKEGIIGAHFLPPGEWVDGARTVVSVFLPFTRAVKRANGADMNRPADEWLHARYEGQEFQAKTCRFAANLLEKEGFPTVAPMTDPRYTSGNPRFPDKARQEHHTSNWSERHVAYACGLGTFGLSAGLITAKGVAGRFISLVTGARFEENRRFYAKFDEYCIHCGACVRNCPAKAISAEAGKSHPPCSEFLNSIGRQGVRYGCGKCQVNVPCENGIPFKNA